MGLISGCAEIDGRGYIRKNKRRVGKSEKPAPISNKWVKSKINKE